MCRICACCTMIPFFQECIKLFGSRSQQSHVTGNFNHRFKFCLTTNLIRLNDHHHLLHTSRQGVQKQDLSASHTISSPQCMRSANLRTRNGRGETTGCRTAVVGPTATQGESVDPRLVVGLIYVVFQLVCNERRNAYRLHSGLVAPSS